MDCLSDIINTHLIEHVRLRQLVLEIGGAGKHQAGDVNLVVGDEHLHSCLGHLAHVVMALLQTKTSETQRRLTTAACNETMI